MSKTTLNGRIDISSREARWVSSVRTPRICGLPRSGTLLLPCFGSIGRPRAGENTGQPIVPLVTRGFGDQSVAAIIGRFEPLLHADVLSAVSRGQRPFASL